MGKKRAIIYGTGHRGRMMLELINNLENFEVVGIIDGDTNKHGQKFYDYVIQEPQAILELKFDCILVASVFFDEIKEKLRCFLSEIQLELVVDAKITLEKYYIEKELRKQGFIYDETPNRIINQNEKIVIYTALFGNYDDLLEPEYIDDNIDYICFTDNDKLTSKVWKIVYVDEAYECSNRAAKIYKILPHRYFGKYDWSIWVDATYKIHKDLRFLLNNFMGRENILFFPHNQRNCCYIESEVCINKRLDDADVITKQMNRYRDEGYPKHNGLICGSCIIRKHNDPEIVRLMETWWNEILIGSRRDQLSFNYASWKCNKKYHLINLNFDNNLYFTINAHKNTGR